MTPAWLRPHAEADLVERSRYYTAEAGDEVAEQFFDAAIAALRAIERMPGRARHASASSATSPACGCAESPDFRAAGTTSYVPTTSTSSVSSPTPKTSPPSWTTSTTRGRRRPARLFRTHRTAAAQRSRRAQLEWSQTPANAAARR